MNKYIKNLNNTIKIKEKYIIAADFETLLINNEHYVFAIGLFFKGIYKNIYIKKNLKNDEEIIENSYKILNEFIVYLLSLSDNTIYIYFHNLGKFDGIFILNIIYKIIKKSDKFSVIIRNNIIYKITYNNLIFLDSLLILNENLNNLANKILNDKKLEIDYNRLNNYYSCINNKNEILLYLYKDVNILYNIILILINKFIDLFYIDITKYFTIPSIAMSIYRTNYLNDYKIYIPEDKEYIYFKKSYRGGLTNIIIPKINDGYIYDINSLYPFIMKTKKMPLGKPIWIYKNFKDLNNYFGFIECKIYIDEFCQIPPLTVKNINDTLVQYTGYIKDVFFIEEIKNSLRYGCKIIEIYNICHFDKSDIIFDKYIDKMYNKRLMTKNNVENLIYKLLMNSLYGRFGINKNKIKTKIIDKKDIWLFYAIYKIDNIFDVDFKKDKIMITYSIDEENINYIKENLNKFYYNKDKMNIINKELKILNEDLNHIITAPQIASCISAYARIELVNHMYNQLNNGGKIYYYDTDSIHTDKKLNDIFVSQVDIGKFKLEHEIKEGYYLSPKIYCIVTKENKEIIKFKGLPKEIIETKNLNFLFFKKIYLNNLNLKYDLSKFFYRKFNNLKIFKKISNYEITFESDKYIKIFNKKGEWVANKFIYLKEK